MNFQYTEYKSPNPNLLLHYDEQDFLYPPFPSYTSTNQYSNTNTNYYIILIMFFLLILGIIWNFLSSYFI